MNKILYDNKIYDYAEFEREENLESKVVEYSKQIFGYDTIYFDAKKKMTSGKISSIPDGFLIDLTIDDSPHFCIIENELSTHDVYKHIGQQMLRHAVSYKNSRSLIKKFLLKEICENKEKSDFINNKITNKYRNIDAFIEDIISNGEPIYIIVIDESSDDLENILYHLNFKIDILEFKTYKNENDSIYEYTPYQAEVRETKETSSKSKIKISDMDTIVVPAQPESVNDVFLGQSCWYAVRISSAMIPKIKYIAAYQTAPQSFIKYYAEVANIERYKDTNKYILKFKSPAVKLKNEIKIGSNPNLAPQSIRYTSFAKLSEAKTLEDIFR